MKRQVLIAARWTARILGVLILLLIAMFAIGEGAPNPIHASIRENLLGLGLLTMIVGQVVAWRWEGIGGLLILGSYIFFAIVNGHTVFNFVFVGPWLLTGLLYLGCWWMKAKATTIV